MKQKFTNLYSVIHNVCSQRCSQRSMCNTLCAASVAVLEAMQIENEKWKTQVPAYTLLHLVPSVFLLYN